MYRICVEHGCITACADKAHTAHQWRNAPYNLTCQVLLLLMLASRLWCVYGRKPWTWSCNQVGPSEALPAAAYCADSTLGPWLGQPKVAVRIVASGQAKCYSSDCQPCYHLEIDGRCVFLKDCCWLYHAGVQVCVDVEGHNVCTVRSPNEIVSMPFNWVAGPATTQSEFFKGTHCARLW